MQTGLHVRAAARAELVDGGDDALGLSDLRRRQHRRGVVAVGDDRDRVVVAEVLDEQGQRRLHEAEAVADVHRAGRVDDEREVRRRTIGVGDGGRVDGDAHQRRAVVGVWRGRRLHADPDRTVGRCGIVVVERVDPLLDPDRRRVWEPTTGQLGQGGAVRPGVDVEGERRLGVVGRRHERRVATVDEHVVLGGVGPVRLGVGTGARGGHRRHRRRHRAAGRHVHRGLSVVVEVVAGVDVGPRARRRIVTAAAGERDGQQAGGEGGDHSVAHGRSDVPGRRRSSRGNQKQ